MFKAHKDAKTNTLSLVQKVNTDLAFLMQEYTSFKRASNADHLEVLITSRSQPQHINLPQQILDSPKYGSITRFLSQRYSFSNVGRQPEWGDAICFNPAINQNHMTRILLLFWAATHEVIAPTT